MHMKLKGILVNILYFAIARPQGKDNRLSAHSISTVRRTPAEALNRPLTNKIDKLTELL